MKQFLQDIYYSVIFIGDSKYKTSDFMFEKAIALIKVICAFAPIAFVLETINFWFLNNKQFIAGFLVVVVINGYFGIKKHRKLNDFDYKIFFIKTRKMLTIVISVYILLSILAKFAGDNIIAEGFQVLIQVMTLFYPISKAIKSIHVIYNGEYPPKWLMDKFYNFEETGDMGDLFDTKKTKKDE